MAERFTITQLSREFDVTTRTIRFYEDEGLIAPERRGQARIYGPRDRVRLRLILRGKRLGFSLSEIKEILDLYDREPGEAGQLRQQREDIDVTLAELATVEARCDERLAALEGSPARPRPAGKPGKPRA